MSALTQLMHEGPRSSVNFSQHVQPQSALGTTMGGPGHVQSTSQSNLKQMDSHSPGHLPTTGSITQLHTAYIFCFCFQPKTAGGRKGLGFFVFVYFSAKIQNLFIFPLLLFYGRKRKSIFTSRPLVSSVYACQVIQNWDISILLWKIRLFKCDAVLPTSCPTTSLSATTMSEH